MTFKDYKAFRKFIAENNANVQQKLKARKQLSARDVALLMMDEVMQWREELRQSQAASSKKISDGMKRAAKKFGYKYGRKSRLDYKKVRAMAKRKGMTMTAVAEHFKVSRTRISQIVHNSKEKP
jgi:hypothetical protein